MRRIVAVSDWSSSIIRETSLTLTAGFLIMSATASAIVGSVGIDVVESSFFWKATGSGGMAFSPQSSVSSPQSDPPLAPPGVRRGTRLRTED